MLMVQAAPGFSGALHVFVWLKGPEAVIPWMVRTPGPAFVNVAFSTGLVVKTVWFGNTTLAGENVTVGRTPTPVKGKD